MSQVYLEIESIEDLMGFIEGAKENGLLKDISCEKVRTILKSKDYPLRFPINVNQVFGVVSSNPLIKKVFGKKIEESALKAIIKIANE